jgi:acetyl-CoA acetyltransferase
MVRAVIIEAVRSPTGRFLGASDARIMTTMLYPMRKKGIQYELQAMCAGGAQANVTISELR